MSRATLHHFKALGYKVLLCLGPTAHFEPSEKDHAHGSGRCSAPARADRASVQYRLA